MEDITGLRSSWPIHNIQELFRIKNYTDGYNILHKLNLILLVLLLFLVAVPAYGQFLSEQTGLVNRINIEAGGHTFEVKTVANFDIVDSEFDLDEKRLTFFIHSTLENNLGETIIPLDLLGGDLTFRLNGEEYFPKARSNERIYFVSINFTGSGDNRLDIVGTTYREGLTEVIPPDSMQTVMYNYAAVVALAGASGAVIVAIVVMRRKRA